MGHILQGRYTDFANEDNDYPDVFSIKKIGFMPSPRPTIASQSQSIARIRKEEKVSIYRNKRTLSSFLYSFNVNTKLKLKRVVFILYVEFTI